MNIVVNNLRDCAVMSCSIESLREKSGWGKLSVDGREASFTEGFSGLMSSMSISIISPPTWGTERTTMKSGGEERGPSVERSMLADFQPAAFQLPCIYISCSLGP